MRDPSSCDVSCISTNIQDGGHATKDFRSKYLTKKGR